MRNHTRCEAAVTTDECKDSQGSTAQGNRTARMRLPSRNQTVEESPESTAMQWRGLAKLPATKTAARRENAEFDEK